MTQTDNKKGTERNKERRYGRRLLMLCVPTLVSLLLTGQPAPALPLALIAAPHMLPQVLTAIGLILLLAALLLALRGRRMAEQARSAGMEPGPAMAAPSTEETRTHRFEVSDGNIMIIGSTGRSLSAAGSALADVLGRCSSAKIMLLDPREQGAFARSQSIPDPEITVERIREEIVGAIVRLRMLRASGVSVLLKLYPDMPLFKLVITDNAATFRHYHPSLNVRLMPEFVFRDSGKHGGLYLPLYRYFLARWNDPDIPEYDFDADELVYHDQLGAEVLREPFLVGPLKAAAGLAQEMVPERSYVFRSEG